MKKILSNIGVVSGCLVFSAIHSQVQAQTRTVTGTVNNGKKSISGVVVIQEGSSQMTTTTATGAFSLQITGENPILIFRHPEYSEQKLNTEGKTTFTIALTEKVKSIEEVVLNAGYYNVKAKESTGSIARVTSKDIENQPVNNVLSAVQGRMAGVSIVQNSGVAGGGFDVQIRGRNSLRTNANSAINANVPLYIIDGVPVWVGNEFKSNITAAILPYEDTNPLNAINPDDIESIEVLKDADATAIYGSKGSNGVILVTTKKGKKGKTEVSMTTSYGLASAARLPKMMTTAQYINMRKDAYANDGITKYPTDAYDVNGTWDTDRMTDFQKYFVGNTAEQSSAKVQMSGGGQNTQFLLSAGHDEQTTVFPGSYRYKRNNVGLNLTHQSTDKKLTLNLSAYYTQQSNSLPITDYSRIYSVAPNSPTLFTEEGKLNWEKSTFLNPLAAASQLYRVKSDQLVSNLSINYRILEGLVLSVNSGYTNNSTEERSFLNKTYYNPALNFGSERSSTRLTSPKQLGWTIEPQANLDRQWGENRLQVLVGGTFQGQTVDNRVIQGSNFPSDELLENIGAATTIKINSTGHYDYRYQAIYGRINYQYDSRYILNITGRRDGSSRFGDNKRYANFAAAGVAWLFSKEDFLKDIKWLSFGKLRASYGSAGSDLIGNYQFYDTYQTTTYTYDGTKGMIPSRLYNPDFGWERTNKLEAAIELGFLKDRLNMTASWYRNRSSNQLVGIPLSSVTGFTSYQGNLPATVENSGLEFTLQSVNFKNKNFSWDTSLNLSVPKNELISFPNLAGSTYANSLVIGYSTTINKLYHYLGVDPVTGIYQFEDRNGDGKLDVNDKYVIKDIGPTWYGGILNNLRYNLFELSILVQLSNQSLNNQSGQAYLLGSMRNLPVEFMDYWTPERQNATYQKPSSGANTATITAAYNYTSSDATVSDIFYMKLKNVSVKYNLPSSLIGSLRAAIFLEGQNLATWSNFKGPDPEFIFADYLPPLRTVSLGITLKF